MKKRYLILAGVILWAVPVESALRFGLGNAVAKQGAQLTNKAGTVVGPNGLPLLPSCGSQMALFTQAPVPDPSIVGLSPLGHSSGSHILPTDHMYFNYEYSQERLPDPSLTLVAPSNGWVVQITQNNATSGAPYGINPSYFIAFSPCREVTLNFLEVGPLSPAVAAALAATPASYTYCSSYGSGSPGPNPEEGMSCQTTMQMPVHAGDVLATTIVDDFGPLEDTRMSFSGFANPARHNLHRGFCPLSYFVPGVLPPAQYTPGYDVSGTLVPSTAPPYCGAVMQDIPGTAQGDWYPSGVANPDESVAMALDHDSVFPSTAVFSMGTSMPASFQGSFYIHPKATADGTRINYDFNLVSDNQIYCYDTFQTSSVFPPTSPLPSMAGYIVLIQLTDAAKDTLKIEIQNPGTTCTATAGTWTFTSAAVSYQR